MLIAFLLLGKSMSDWSFSFIGLVSKKEDFKIGTFFSLSDMGRLYFLKNISALIALLAGILEYQNKKW